VISTDVQPPHPLAIRRKCGTSCVINNSIPIDKKNYKDKIEKHLEYITISFEINFTQCFFKSTSLKIKVNQRYLLQY
jgi:hypothetical protein